MARKGQRYSSTKSIGTEDLPRGYKLQFVSSALVGTGCPRLDILREICYGDFCRTP
jgi:hypothetical protein